MVAAIVDNQRSFVDNNGDIILRHKNSKWRRPGNLKSKTADIHIHIFVTLKLSLHCDGHILISFVFPQFTSFHSVFHSFHGLMNSINWPAPGIWVFIAQLGEHCSANAEATSSNPVEAPKNFFSDYFRYCLNCDSLRWSHTHFTF